MKTMPRAVRTELSSAGAGGTTGATAHLHFKPVYGPVEFAPSLHLEAPLRIRLGLQQRAVTNLHNHVLRAVRRFGVLLVADLASFYVMREVVRVVRDYAWFGDSLAGQLEGILPHGIINGWQYAVALFVALFLTGNYGRGDQRRDTRQLFIACALATALPLWMTIWTRGLEPVMLQYAVTTLLMWAGLVAERRAIDRIVVRFFPMYRNAAPTLFVGPAEACRDAIASPGFALGGECRPVGFVDVHLPPARDALGHAVDFRSLLHRSGAEVVVVAGYLPDNRFREVVDASLEAEAQLLSIPRSIAIAGVQPTLVWRRGQPLIELTAPSLKGWQLALKRLVDIVGAGLGLLAASPLMFLVGIAIKLGSPGPVLFQQERVGRGGRRFRIVKFRTMRSDADEGYHRTRASAFILTGAAPNGSVEAGTFKILNDPRVTRLGAVLRRYSVDELPQLWNVLRGDMSLVGPRPQLSYEFELYDQWEYERLNIKPGITGLWQVSGRSALNHERMCELDIRYVREWSLLLDLKILAKTVPVVLSNSGKSSWVANGP